MYNFKNRNKGVKIKLGLLCAFFAVLLCCLAISLGGLFSVQKNGAYASADNAKTGHITAPTANSSPASARSAEALATAWNAAVQESIDNDTQVTFTLTEDWQGDRHAGFGSGIGFGTDGMILVPAAANMVIDLGNFSLIRNSNIDDHNEGGAITVEGRLELKGNGNITEVHDYSGIGAIRVKSLGQLTMNGGNIVNNDTKAVNVDENGTFIMNGGRIFGNSRFAGSEDGVIEVNNGTFIMNDGEISANTLRGVVAQYSNIEINGGRITNNTSSKLGGGVYFFENGRYGEHTFKMTGGEISGNTSAGGDVFLDISINKNLFTKTGGTIENGPYFAANENGWNNAVQSSIDNNIQVGVALTGDWSLTSNLTGVGFNNGSIKVPANADIILNLIGHTLSNWSVNESTIYVYGTLTLIDSVGGGNLIGNVGHNTGGTHEGSAVYVLSGKFIMNSGSISGNDGSSSAVMGIVHVKSGATFEMNGGKISNNKFVLGAVYVAGNFTMNGGEISGNATVSEGCGGGVYVAGTQGFTPRVYLNGGEISGNSAKNGGGVYMNNFTSVEINGCKISNNTASSDGGGIYLVDSTYLKLIDGIISGNTAVNGGGVYIYGGNAGFDMSGGTISDNRATEGGGGVYTIKGTIILNEGNICYNTGDTGGGGVALYEGAFTINGGEVSNNVLTSEATGVNVDILEGQFEMNGGLISGVSPYEGIGSLSISGGYCVLNKGEVRTSGIGVGITISLASGYNIANGFKINSTDTVEAAIRLGSNTTSGIIEGIITGGKCGIFANTSAFEYFGEIANCDYGMKLDGYSQITFNGTYYDNKIVDVAYYGSSETDWNAAITLSKKLGANRPVGFILSRDWTATVVDSGGMYPTSFGTGVGFNAQKGFAIPEEANIVFDLNGHKIDFAQSSAYASVLFNIDGKFTLNDSIGSGVVTGASANYGATIWVNRAGSFTLNGGIIKGNSVSQCGAVYLTDSTFTMNGGEITDNRSINGNTISMNDASSFIMNGGIISNNTGEAVRINGSSTFTMNGGEISGNDLHYSGSSGSGIIILSSGTNFNMNGGIISGNKNSGTATNMAAVYVYQGTVRMYGGEITGNTCGGVYLETHNTGFAVKGSPRITDNTKSGSASNLYSKSKVITISGKLTGARIGITLSNTTGMFTAGYSSSGNGSSFVSAYFFSDAGKKIVYNSGEVEITSATAPAQTTLTWQYRLETDGVWTTVEDGFITIEYSGAQVYVMAQNTSGDTVSIYCYNGAGGIVSVYKNTDTYGFVVYSNADKYTNPTFTLTITPKTVNIGWDETELRYNGSEQYPKPIVSGLVHGDKVNVDVTGGIATIGHGQIEVTGLSGENAGNYKLDTSKKYICYYEILRAQLDKPVSTGSNEFTYDGTERTFTVALANGLSISANKAINAGDYTAVVSLDKEKYEWKDGTQSDVNFVWTINKKNIFVSGISVANKAYDGTKTATVDTSKVELSGVIAADKAKLGLEFTAGSEFDSSAVGMRSVQISGIALKNITEEDIAQNYILEFDAVTRYAQIYPATLKVDGVSVAEGGRQYDGTIGGVVFDKTGLSITATEGGIPADELASLIENLKITGVYKNKNVGTDGVRITGYTLGGEYAGNYYVDAAASEQEAAAEITKAEVSVTLGKNEYTVEYGNGLKITYSQSSPVQSESVTLALEYYDESGNVKLDGVPTDAGTYTVKVVVSADDANAGNYTVITSGDGIISQAKVVITKASLTVTVADKEIEYGSAKPADSEYELKYNGWLNGDGADFESGLIEFVADIVISTDYDPADADNKNAASYAIELSEGELENYALTYVNGTLKVLPKKVTVEIDDKTSVYGATEAELTSNASEVAVADDDLGITLTRADATNKNVGKYAITGSASNANYAVTFVNGEYEITKATLTVTAKPNAITYGDAASNDGAELAGFANGDDESVLSGTLGYRYTYTRYGDIYELDADGVTLNEIEYYIIPYGLSADNYEIEYVNGLLTVNKKSATVTVSNAASDITNVPADRAEAALNIKYAVTGTVNGDDLAVKLLIAETGTRQDGNVSYGTTWCEVGEYDITGSFDNTNYIVTFVYENGVQHGTYTVKQGTLTITANTLILSYGEEIKFGAADEAVTAEGLPVGSSLSDLIASGVISGVLSVLDGSDGAYGEYAGMGLPYGYGDDIFDSDGNRINYIVIPTGLASSSYNIVFKPGKLMIEPKSIVVNLDGKSSVYGEQDKALTASVADGALVNYDPDTQTVADFLAISGLKREEGTDAGSYAITAEGCGNKNYRVTFVNGVYTITPYEVTLIWSSGKADESEANDFSYVYNGEMRAPVASFTMPNPEDPSNPLVYKSTDAEATRWIETAGSGMNAGTYKAQAFLLNKNLKFSASSVTTQNFEITKKQLTVSWYKDNADKGDADKKINAPATASTPVEYKYKSGYPFAPVVEIEGIIEKDNNANFYYISGEQNAVSITPYEAVLHILNANYAIAEADTRVYFTIVMSAPDGFKWYETSDFTTEISSLKEYVYNGEAQQPYAKSLGEDMFVYTIYVLEDGGESIVGAAINTGNYKVVATPVDNNLQLPADAATFYFNITAKTVEVVWSADTFEYNGGKQVPDAYYTDVTGQRVTLEVKLADGENGTDANADGEAYHASVTLDTANYTFSVDGANVNTVEKTYTITAKNITVTWTSKYTEDDGTPKWEMEYDNKTQNDAVTGSAEMQNAVAGDNLGLEMSVWYSADGKSEPVRVDKILDAGVYTLRVTLADGVNSANYKLTDDEQTFVITKKQLNITAENKEVNTGDSAAAPTLTAKFEGFAAGEDESSLNLINADGGLKYLATNYNFNSPYIAAEDYTKPEDIEKLETIADIIKGGFVGYFIAFTDSEAALEELNAILRNYDVNFSYGRITIIAVEGTVNIVLTQSYNGEEQVPGAKYKVGGKWLDLKVEVYDDEERTVKSESVKNVGTYYLVISKYAEDNVQLEGAEADGTVRKEFNIVARDVEVVISDKRAVYGEITEENVQSFLDGLWAYASGDALRRPLEEDEESIAIGVTAEIEYVNGFAIVGSYAVTGKWSEDETLRKNYNVIFTGNLGEDGELKITQAQISYTANVTDGFNQILETEKANGNYLIGLYNKVNGGYEYIDFAGDKDAAVKIYYTTEYNMANYGLTDKLPQDEPEEAWKQMPLCSVPSSANAEYFVNFKIEIANHETYYGQWTVKVISGKAYIRIIFSSEKKYEVTYGDRILEGTELASKLYSEGFVNCLDLPDDVFAGNIENGNLTAKVVADGDSPEAGSYKVVFEGIEKLNPDWMITYKQDVNAADETATNTGKCVVTQRKLAISWDKTSFIYDGEAHLPVPSIDGWERSETTESVNGATVYTFTNGELGKTVKVTVRTFGDFTSLNSENFVRAELTDGNYAFAADEDGDDNATRAVSIITEANIGGETVQSGVLPGWALGVIIALAVLTVIAIIFAATRKRAKPADDPDGFNDPVDL